MDREEEEVSEERRLERKGTIDKNLYSTVQKNLKKHHDKNIQNYNLRSKTLAPVYAIGQKVFRRNFRQSSAANSYNAKLDALYVPCTILARVGTSSYELADETGKSIGIFSVCDLKPEVILVFVRTKSK